MKKRKDIRLLLRNVGFFATVGVFTTYILGGIRWVIYGFLAGIVIGVLHPSKGEEQSEN